MKYSVHMRLTAVISIVFLLVLIFLTAIGSGVIYVGLNEEKDKSLQVKQERMVSLFESEFMALTRLADQERKDIRSRFLEKLEADYAYTQDFVLFSLESEKSRRILSTGVVKNMQLVIPKGFLSKKIGFFNQRLAGQNYRVCISRHSWGTLGIGTQNQTFSDILNEWLEILPIVGPLALIFTLFGGHFLAKIAMKPVVEAARKTDEITLTNLEGRLPEYRGKDEFGALVVTLNNMIIRLGEGVKKIQQFTQDAAHELRTPLTIVRGELESVCQKDTIPGPVHSSIRKALDQTISMSKIVEDLLLLTQSDSGTYPVQKHLFRLDEVMRETYEDVKILAENRPVTVTLNHCDPVRFFGDEQLIRRLLLNISDNALKYTQGGFIQFHLEKQGEEIAITLKDSGIGISDEDLPHVFDRFYRAETTRSQSEHGSGLGLAISQWIVTAHVGNIRIESTLAQGTSVYINLPLFHPAI
jgi:signal transduction histidine kinase